MNSMQIENPKKLAPLEDLLDTGDSNQMPSRKFLHKSLEYN